MGDILIRRATPEDADAVGRLVFELLEELASPAASGYELAAVTRVARDLLDRPDECWCFLAEAGDRTVGVMTLNACASIYAGGRFGEICELYVRPGHRGGAVGRKLIDAAVDFARRHGWTRLEVTAPPPPRGARSVSFYRDAGFVETGPHLKRELR